MSTIVALALAAAVVAGAVELPSKKVLNLAAVKAMIAAAEAEASKRNVQVTLCIVNEAGTLVYLQKADGAGLNTLNFCERKARHAAMFGSPSKNAADQLKAGNLGVLAYPNAFPNQGGLPIKVDGQTIGGIAASGAASEIDEAIAQAALDALARDFR